MRPLLNQLLCYKYVYTQLQVLIQGIRCTISVDPAARVGWGNRRQHITVRWRDISF